MSKVSVIVPCHNVGKFLPKCLESLTGQTFHDIDIVAVENGSTDNTLEVLRKYASADTRITVLTTDIPSQQNARNMGIKAASGEYFMFCDADDWFSPDMCEIMYKAITENETDVACCDVKLEYAEDLSEEEKRLRNSVGYYTIHKSGKYMLDNRRIMRTNVILCNKIMRRDLVEKILPFYPQIKVHEDSLFWYLYAFNAQSIFYVDRQLYHYFLRPHSIMSNVKMTGTKNPNRMDVIKIADDVMDYVLNRGNPTEKETELVILIYEELATVISEMLESDEQIKICDLINRRIHEKMHASAYFYPVGSLILNLEDNHLLPHLVWQKFMLRTHRRFNMLVGKKVSDRLQFKILLNEMKIRHKKGVIGTR